MEKIKDELLNTRKNLLLTICATTIFSAGLASSILADDVSADTDKTIQNELTIQKNEQKDTSAQKSTTLANQEDADGFELNTYNNYLTIGSTFQMYASSYTGEIQQENINWSSSDSSVATVDQTGLVRALKEGQVNIVATIDNYTMTATTNVVAQREYLQDESDTWGNIGMPVGTHQNLVDMRLPETATDVSFSYESDAPDVATINAAGMITALSIGTAHITINAHQYGTIKTDIIDVTVIPIPVTNIELSLPNNSIIAGKSATIEPRISPADATNQTLTWQSSNEDVLTVDDQGNVTAISPGRGTITATASNGITGTVELTVEPTPIERFAVDLPDEMTVGEFYQAAVTDVEPSTVVNYNVIWSSEDDAIATINSSGVITAVAPGTAYINVKVEQPGSDVVSQMTAKVEIKATDK